MSETQRMFHEIWLMRRTTSTVAQSELDRVVSSASNLKRDNTILNIENAKSMQNIQGLNSPRIRNSEFMTPKKI